MKILLTNDDGFFSEGIWYAARSLRTSHEVTVVAPRVEQSGISHAFTLYTPSRIEYKEFDPLRTGWIVNGTPSDCVKMGLKQVLKGLPDLVVSGINGGDNSGISQFYSGTVGGAREAAFWGIPSIAVSVSRVQPEQYTHAADFLGRFIPQVVPLHKKGPVFLNINFPAVAINEIKGVRFTRQGCAMFADDYIHRQDPRKKDYFWIMGDKPKEKFEPDSDDQALEEGYITVTPLSIDSTNWKMLAMLKGEIKGNYSAISPPSCLPPQGEGEILGSPPAGDTRGR
jgi:5'-nucleotidase